MLYRHQAPWRRQTREVRAAVQRARAEREGCHDGKAENAKQCIDCEAVASSSCEVCSEPQCLNSSG